MSVRIDKYLWCVRFYKTRSMATDACKSGKVIVDGAAAKPSKEIKTGDIISVKKEHINYTLKVKDELNNRVGAKLVVNYLEDLTPPEELNKLELMKQEFEYRDRGLGRPTKKERRIISKLKGYDE